MGTIIAIGIIVGVIISILFTIACCKVAHDADKRQESLCNKNR